MPGQSPALPKLPPPPARHRGSTRLGTIFFWTLLVLFLLLLIYLGLLAFHSYNGALQSTGILQDPHVGGAALVVCAFAGVVTCIVPHDLRHR
jgi:ABC-type sulfate transport system permease component